MLNSAAAGQYFQAALGRLSVKSALNPFLWLCITMTPTCFVAAYFFRDYDHVIVEWLLGLGALPLVVTLLIGSGFAIFNASRLQSENFQIRQQSLQLLQGRERLEVIDADAVVAIATTNPVSPLPALPAGDGGQQE
jgi:hypothetical protein